jgi:hypothetical protein
MGRTYPRGGNHANGNPNARWTTLRGVPFHSSRGSEEAHARIHGSAQRLGYYAHRWWASHHQQGGMGAGDKALRPLDSKRARGRLTTESRPTNRRQITARVSRLQDVTMRERAARTLAATWLPRSGKLGGNRRDELTNRRRACLCGHCRIANQLLILICAREIRSPPPEPTTKRDVTSVAPPSGEEVTWVGQMVTSRASRKARRFSSVLADIR